jgi:cytochrome P450
VNRRIVSESIGRPLRRPPSPYDEQELLGILDSQSSKPHEYFLDAAVRYGGFVDLSLPFLPIYLLSRPEYAEHVLQSRASKYRKGAIVTPMASLLGRGLLTSDGPFWLRQRRLVQPSFHKPRVQEMGGPMLQGLDRLTRRWRGLTWRRQPVDILTEMFRLSLDVTLALTFGQEPDADRDVIMKAVLAIDRQLAEPRGSAVAGHLETLDAAIYRQIERHRLQPGSALVDQLLTARAREDGRAMSDRELRDELVTLIFAGHETTACLLGWIWCLLATHPEADAMLRRELASTLDGEGPTVAGVKQLQTVTSVVREALRLYPPVWNLSRTAEEADEIDGYAVDAGSLVLISPYVLHRHPALWERPDAFEPSRFAVTPPRFAYLPFGTGPRVCIGDGVGLLEAQLAVAVIASRFVLTPLQPVSLSPVVTPTTLRPPDGVLMHLG